MKRFLLFALMIASTAAWIAWYRLPRPHALLWIALLGLLIFLCHCMACWRTSWPRYVTFLMAFISVAIAFTIMLGFRVPQSALLFHDFWVPAVAIAFCTAARAYRSASPVESAAETHGISPHEQHHAGRHPQK